MNHSTLVCGGYDDFSNSCVKHDCIMSIGPGDDDGCPYSIPYFLFSVCCVCCSSRVVMVCSMCVVLVWVQMYDVLCCMVCVR
mmetsp:Transcript_64677/g.72307  ORF Transcript_64677/g.72307 Transcript_64677/m.72307 type:complete len:82 (-) Transcript_64677:122-367(-)